MGAMLLCRSKKEKRAEARFPWIAADASDQYLLSVPSTSSAQALMPPVML